MFLNGSVPHAYNFCKYIQLKIAFETLLYPMVHRNQLKYQPIISLNRRPHINDSEYLFGHQIIQVLKKSYGCPFYSTYDLKYLPPLEFKCTHNAYIPKWPDIYLV